MKLLTSGIMAIASAGLLMLGACSKAAKTSDETSTNSATPPAETTTAKQPTVSDGQPEKSHMSPKKGGQVVESGKYHLELVPEKTGSNTHLDFYLVRGDNHQIVPNAKVTANLQSPDGKQKTLPFSYSDPN
jgi:hypothetical protein